ncbi:MAG: ABC transporter substrate-binding protein [Thermoleophilia bacterium]
MRPRWLLLAVLAAAIALLAAACGGSDEASPAPAEPAPAEPAAPAPAEPAEPAEPAPAEPAPAEPAPAEPAEPAPAEPAPAPAESGAAPTGDPIVIGMPISLTGDLAPWGLWPQQMAEFAVEDINAAGGVLGRPIQLVTADDKSDFAANGAAAAIEVIDKGASIIVTDCDFDWSAPAQSEATGRGIPGISFCAGAPNFGPNGLGPLTFSAGIATPNEAIVPAEWSFNEQGWKSAFILNDPVIDYDTTYCASYKQAFQDLGGTIAGEDTFEQADPQLQSVITRFQSLDPQPDFIVLCSIPPGGATAIRQLRAAGIETPIFMGVGMGGDWWFESVGSPLSNAYQSTYGSWLGDDEIQAVNDLAARYQEKYDGPVPLPHALMGYQVIQVVADAIERAGSTEGEAIAAALQATDGSFLFGPFTFNTDYNHSFTFPVTIMKIDAGKASFLKRLQPQGDAVALWQKVTG